MKKEKQVKTYQRRTKSGKVVTVKAHTAKYDAAEKAKEAAKKKGAGSELAAKKGSVKEAISSRSKKEAELIREQLEKYGGEKGKEIAKEEPKTPAKKATTKKTTEKAPAKKKISRPVGSGTNGPTQEDKVISKAKTMYSHNNPSGSKDKIALYLQKKGYSLKEAKSKATSIEKDAKKRKQSLVEQGQFPTRKSKTTSSKATSTPKTSSGVSSAEFKTWYHDPKSKEGKAAAKKLKEQVGAEKYKELNKKANASYSSRGHLSLFKGLSGASATKTSSQKREGKPKAVKEAKVNY